MFQLVYCVGGSLKNLCHYELGGGVWQMLTSSGGGGRSMLTVAGRGMGGKICQNLANVICERSLIMGKSDVWGLVHILTKESTTISVL